MNNIKYISYALVFCWAVIGLSQEAKPDSIEEVKPGLSFNLMEYDFGVIKSGTQVIHVFRFENVSLDTIKINKVGTS